MNTYELLDALCEKRAKEQVLEALEKLQLMIQLGIMRGHLTSAEETLKRIVSFTGNVRDKYNGARISYFKAAKDIAKEATADIAALDLKVIRV